MRYVMKWVFVAAVSALVTSSANAQDKVTLRMNLKPGMTWTFEQSQEMTANNKATFNGQTQPFNSKGSSSRSGKAQVVSVGPDGSATSLRITFDDNLSSSQEMNGQRQVMPFAYAGKTVTVTRGPNGNVTDDFQGQADPASTAELHNAIEGFRALFPKQPVAVGEEWPADNALLAKLMQLQNPNDRAGATMKLLGSKQVDGRDVAEVKVSTAVQSQPQPQLDVQMVMQGTVLIDKESGQVLASDLKGTSTSKGTGSEMGPDGPVQYQLEGDGTIAIKSTTKIVGKGGEVADGPGPFIAPPPGNVGAGGDVMAGTYADEKIILKLEEAGRGFGGTITMGDQKFPITARAGEGGKITGQFDAAGEKFDFSGSLDGNTLKLETGGTTYTLKKAGGRNPLAPGGDAPKPKNPLGDRIAPKAVDTVAGPAPAPAPAPKVDLQTFNFPDGTGSIGLANGWRTNATTCAQGFLVEGPADQKLTVGMSLSIVTPDSQSVQLQRQMEQQARDMGMAPPPRIPMLVAPLTDPVTAMQNLVPQFSQMSRAKGGPTVEVSNLQVREKPQSSMQGGQAAVLAYDIAKTTPDGRTTRSRAVARVETAPLGQDAWMYWACEAQAPEASFDADLPAMIQMLGSWKVDNQGLARVTKQNIDASNRQFEDGQRRHKELTASFDRYNESWRQGQVTQQRGHDDFIETIRGTRTVEDTRTGERHDADLGTVDQTVDTLNENDPGRFKQIPLRDQR